MRIFLLALLLSITPGVAHAATGDIPLVAIGLPFAPEAPRPLAPDHTLYHRIAVAEIEDMPATVGNSLIGIFAAAKRSSVNKGLRETLDRMNMLAPSETDARARLIVRWGGVKTPFVIATSGRSTATLTYELRRISTGDLLFQREISTTAEGEGIDAGMRVAGTARAAIATNFASMALCLKKASAGTAPQDCALQPLFKVLVERQTRF